MGKVFKFVGGIAAISFAFTGSPVYGQLSETPDKPSKPRFTTDKMPLPPAGPRAVDIKLSVIGNRLGALPEQICTRIFAFNADVPMVQQSRRDLTKSGADLEGINYIGDGAVGFARTFLAVDRGRVKKMILAKPSMTDEAAATIMDKMAIDSQSAPKKSGNTVTFKVDNIRFYVRPVGGWSKVIPGETKQILGTGGRTKTTPDKTVKGPHAIEIGIVDFDWTALNITNDPTKLEAILKGKLLLGMSYVEAYAAMRGNKCYRSGQGKDDQVWTWTRKEVEETDTSVFTGDFGTFSKTTFTKAERPFAKATFKGGVVVSIENEETMGMPPG